jgi:hypothetical protein
MKSEKNVNDSYILGKKVKREVTIPVEEFMEI